MAFNSSSVSAIGSFEKFRQYPSPGFFGKVSLYFFYLFSDHRKNKGVVQPPYGIRMYVGLPGTGKTVSMVEYLLTLRMAYPGIKIYTNFGFQYQDGDIVSLDDFQKYNDPNGVVFAVDEL